ncbi:Protein of unknown function [Pedobacter terrae]|uniref:DUF3606 domain-containing protein n=2 Tax=Pedobacter terrae TaxID=405671 RepID=A0A1G7W361_9SPHI|nr:Protein of unknown function [Pedobacter terrae]
MGLFYHYLIKKVMDDKQKTGSADRTRININEGYELDYWSAKFGVSKEKLKAAVDTVGTSASAVEDYLKK